MNHNETNGNQHFDLVKTEHNQGIPDMGDHFMADHIEHDEDFNWNQPDWNQDVKPLWKPQEITSGE